MQARGIAYGLARGIASGIVKSRGAAPINTSNRNIASGGRAPNSLVTAGNTESNYRSAHINESGVATTELAVLYPAWYITTTSTTAAPAAFTVESAIEYPSGTMTRVTFSGSNSKSLTPGTNTLSDYVAVAIPAGAQFWIRTYVQVASSAVQWPRSLDAPTTGGTLLEACEIGTGIGSKVMSGTISGSSIGYRPLGVVGKYAVGMKKVSMAGFGDSIAYGSGDGNYDASNNKGFIGRSASGRCPYMILALTGSEIVGTAATGLSMRIEAMQLAGITDAVVNLSSNDIAGGASVASVQAAQGTLVAALIAAGMKVHFATVGPRSTSTDTWFTLAGQTPNTNWNGSSANGHVYNDWLRTMPNGITTLIDKCDMLSTSRYSGIWITGDSNPQARLLSSSNYTATGTPTTTNIPFTPTLPSSAWNNYFQFGKVEFTSGVASPATVSSGITNSSSSITFSTPLTVPPIAGDTLTARPSAVRAVNDGIHPVTNNNSSSALSTFRGGGVYILADYLGPIIDGWLA